MFSSVPDSWLQLTFLFPSFLAAQLRWPRTSDMTCMQRCKTDGQRRIKIVVARTSAHFPILQFFSLRLIKDNLEQMATKLDHNILLAHCITLSNCGDLWNDERCWFVSNLKHLSIQHTIMLSCFAKLIANGACCYCKTQSVSSLHHSPAGKRVRQQP